MFVRSRVKLSKNSKSVIRLSKVFGEFLNDWQALVVLFPGAQEASNFDLLQCLDLEVDEQHCQRPLGSSIFNQFQHRLIMQFREFTTADIMRKYRKICFASKLHAFVFEMICHRKMRSICVRS
jgi:hypothetical protein